MFRSPSLLYVVKSMSFAVVLMFHILFQTIESRLKVTLPDNLPAALKDGVVLCHLANHIRPRSVSSIHVPSPSVVSITLCQLRHRELVTDNLITTFYFCIMLVLHCILQFQ